MLPKRRETLLIVGLGATAILALALFAWHNGSLATRPESLLLRLPTQDAVVVGADFQAVRRSGFLDPLFDSKTPQDADYTAFVRDTGFDYRRDLDYVLASFAPDGEFFLVKGASIGPNSKSMWPIKRAVASTTSAASRAVPQTGRSHSFRFETG